MLRNLIIFALAFVSSQAIGQQAFPKINSQLSTSSVVVMNQFQIPADAILIDAEDEKLYIDFERIKTNLKEIKLSSTDGKQVYTKDVSSMPVDAILEIDFSSYEKGQYLLEVNTYVQSLHQRLEL